MKNLESNVNPNLTNLVYLVSISSIYIFEEITADILKTSECNVLISLKFNESITICNFSVVSCTPKISKLLITFYDCFLFIWINV